MLRTMLAAAGVAILSLAFVPPAAALDARYTDKDGDLLADIPTLTAILTSHVVAGQVMSGDLSDGMTAVTVNGQSITIGVGEAVTVNEATVISADIAASNGVIHVIDQVILPE